MPKSDETMETLIRRRASYKGQVTAFKTYISNLDAASLTAVEVGELQLRTDRFESLYTKYDEVQLDIECFDENLEAPKDRVEFENSYYQLLAQAHNILAEHKKQMKDDEDSQSSVTTRVRKQRLVKLPTIQLPKFNGAYENWLQFRDTFASLIDSVEDIDEINKFHYLRASLEGSAAVVIQSVEFSAKNYSVAWKLLCERYDNKRLLIQNHVSALFNMEAITKESSVSLKRLIDNLNKNLRALESLGEPVKTWDTLIIYIVVHKLDSKSFREWEEYKGRLDKSDSATLDTFITFLRNHADLIETIESSRNTSQVQPSSAVKNSPKIKALVSVQQNDKSVLKVCPKCNGEHALSDCPQFLALSNEARLNLLPQLKLCFNCFRADHFANRCKKPGCKICKRKHNALVHVADFKQMQGASGETTHHAALSADTRSGASTAAVERGTDVALTANVTAHGDVLLSTALVKLYDGQNREFVARALLDSGSTACLMTEKMSKQLNLPPKRVNKSILGINNTSSHVGNMCHVLMKSLNEDFSTMLQCYVLPTITDEVPCRQVDISNVKIPSDLCLADPNFHAPASIDLIIGADVFWDILGLQHIKLGVGKPVMQETKLGWIISGPLNNGVDDAPLQCSFVKVDDIHNLLPRFWQLEEVSPQSSTYSAEEKSCEEHFMKHTTRQEDGRFCVRIPLKESAALLGNSYNRAKYCLLSLERRLKGQPKLEKMYKEFLSEYESLGHMSECHDPNPEADSYYIPHHGVLRENRTTTKLRVVFNASSPTTSGVSLNNIEMVGPTVQDSLFSILLRFRMHKYVLSADVEKMYRCVMVHKDDRHLQRILWRDNPSEDIKVYELNTVTYGTASAPFLATRCLKQIGLDCKDKDISDVIIHDFYVDDLLTSTNELQKAMEIRDKVSAELASAGMNLRKWKSNDSRLVSEPDSTSVNLDIGTDLPVKTLGLTWESKGDELLFPIKIPVLNKNTKRDMLSTISQIFDPLGLLAPCIIKMKMLLQKLWLEKLDWDDQLPTQISHTWTTITEILPVLNELRLPRPVVCDACEKFELHIFTDASERAYGACVYVRSVNEKGEVSVRLLTAKSRVAPLKPTTIPRLELCAALVGTRLYEKVIDSLRTPIDQVTFWSDSMIVLAWLKMLPIKLQPFVRNRVAEILEKAGICTWRHVPTSDNPADLISRGLDVKLFMRDENDLWWSGPQFLKQDNCHWPTSPGTVDALPELKPAVALLIREKMPVDYKGIINFHNFSNYLRLIRAIAYLLRFVNRCRKKLPSTSYINNNELKNSLNFIIRTSQRESFSEYELLLHKQPLPKKSSLLKLNVFLDEDLIMRVGGRLENSNFSYEKKHPILIQSTHRFTKLLFNYEHINLMHAGPQLLLASIRETYWPIGGRNLAKFTYHQCYRCRRLKGQVVAPLMGNLPQQRLQANGYPFESVGIDYAGPISSASRQGRGCRLVKVYIAVFVCFTTKAIHLELVGDLTSNTFMLALRRFMSRRGKPINIYSDNGTSFVGAYNELSKFLKANCSSLSESAANQGINFHFIPAYSPHFGGLWEAGVKSTKCHLQRVLGNCNLTYEELNTTLTGIEAILNSRPLTPISSDPDDMTPLTPGHFLIGRPMTSLPTANLLDQSNILSRYKRIEFLRQQFWARWSTEYVAELQMRTKWRSDHDPLKLGSLVLIKEDNVAPLKWKLGRVMRLYPGADGVSRVADLKTSSGMIRRSFSKICPLPETSNGC